MTLSATYNDDLARVQLSVTGAPAGADYAHFERSTDGGITWEDVRGGQTVGITGGSADLSDFEFTPGASNAYRATYVDTGMVPTFVGAGTAATGVNTSLSPAPPSGVAEGDVKVILASIRNSGAGSVNTPTGWTKVVESGNVALLAKVHQAGDVAPTVTFAGGVTNADTLAQMAAFRGMQMFPDLAPATLNDAAQNVTGLGVTQIPGAMIQVAWKQDDMTSSTTPAFATKIGDVSSTAGDDAAMAWFFFGVPGTNAGLPFNPWPVVINGGAAAISRGIVAQFPVVTNIGQDTASTVPAMTDVWLKNVLRPNLNQKVQPVGRIAITRKSRSGVFDIVGRTMPVAVTDVRGSREFQLQLAVDDWNARDVLDNALATGDVLHLHVPPGSPTQSAFVMVGDTSYDDTTRLYTLPLTEVARPDGTLIGDTILWIDVLAEYPTWADVIAGEATWSDLVSQIASGSDTVVP